MNLVELFQVLSPTETGNEKILNTISIPEYPKFRIAMDVDGNPVLLLPVLGSIQNAVIKNHRLKYLQLQQNKECKINENDTVTLKTYTLITFTSSDRDLQEYFLRISETLVKSLNIELTHQDISETLNKFIEVFRTLTDPPTKTIQGLWSELFLIENSKSPKLLIHYWHNFPEEKFDFDAGQEKIEVKSSSSFERIHTFSSEQLNPPQGEQVLIASVFMRQNNSGHNIQQLIESISLKLQNDTHLIEKLNAVVCKTLGNSLEQSIKIKFDYQVAKDSLKFYNHQDISKIEEVYIPTEISQLKYKSDLSKINSIDTETIKTKGNLFKSM